MDRILKARIRVLHGVVKGIDERINKSVFNWLDHIERMGYDRIPKRVYVGECMDSCLVGQPEKRWINSE